MRITAGQTNVSIPKPGDQLTVENLHDSKVGSFTLSGDGIAVTKQVQPRETIHVAVHKNALTFDNTGKTDFEVN